MSNFDEFVVRDTEVIKISDIGNRLEFLHPERLKIRFDERVRASPYDLGAVAYRLREFHGLKGFAVVESSLVEGRREILRCILDHVYVSGWLESSIHFFLKAFEVIMRWCDANGHTDVFMTPEASRAAYLAYSQDLHHHMLVLRDVKPDMCCTRQRSMRGLIELLHNDDSAYVMRGVPIIKSLREPRKVPDEDSVRQSVGVCIKLATQISSFLMEGRPYPLLLKFDKSEVPVYPTHGKLLTPYSSRKVSASLSGDGARLSAPEDHSGSFPDMDSYEMDRSRADIHKALIAANSELRCQHRLRIASLALSVYAYLFNLITAAGASEFVEFQYDEAMEIEESLVKKELTAIKLRARGLTTRYAIGRGQGRALLRDYLKFREWVLDGERVEYLFFGIKKRGVYLAEYSQLSSWYTNKLFQQLKGVFLPEDFKSVSPASVRKFKSLILHELRVSASLVADSLNHTPQVNVTSYSEASEGKQQEEFSMYWQSVRKAADVVRNRTSAETNPTVIGHCADEEKPVRLFESVPIEPNCSTQHGCLFCENYLCHADYEDVHKLLSFSYVINAVRDTAKDIEHAEQMFRDLSIRIEVVVEAVAGRSLESASLVKEVKHQVWELGILTPFWESRLYRYEKLGVVF